MKQFQQRLCLILFLIVFTSGCVVTGEPVIVERHYSRADQPLFVYNRNVHRGGPGNTVVQVVNNNNNNNTNVNKGARSTPKSEKPRREKSGRGERAGQEKPAPTTPVAPEPAPTKPEPTPVKPEPTPEPVKPAPDTPEPEQPAATPVPPAPVENDQPPAASVPQGE